MIVFVLCAYVYRQKISSWWNRVSHRKYAVVSSGEKFKKIIEEWVQHSDETIDSCIRAGIPPATARLAGSMPKSFDMQEYANVAAAKLRIRDYKMA